MDYSEEINVFDIISWISFFTASISFGIWQKSISAGIFIAAIIIMYRVLQENI